MYFRENDQPIENYTVADAGDVPEELPYVKETSSTKTWLFFLLIVALLSGACYLLVKVTNRRKDVKTYYSY